MSDLWSGKWRPALERIACMVGKGKGLPYLPSGAIPNFTDHDICHAVAASRRTVAGKPDKRGNETRTALARCVRPEILELCYAGDLQHIGKIAGAAAEEIRKVREKSGAQLATTDVIRIRHGALIAIRSLAGREYTQADLKREAWSIACNYEALELETGAAKAWIEYERYAAATAFLHALKSRLDYTMHDVSAYQAGLECESRAEREAAIRKEFPRIDDATMGDALRGEAEGEPFDLLEAIKNGRPARFGMLTLQGVLTE